MTVDGIFAVGFALVLIQFVEWTGKRIKRPALAPLGFKPYLDDLESLRQLGCWE
jgi:hypothetical protein